MSQPIPAKYISESNSHCRSANAAGIPTVLRLTFALSLGFAIAFANGLVSAQTDLLKPASGQTIKSERPSEFKTPYLIEFKREIDAKSAKYFFTRLAKAKTAGADLIVVEIESPGGGLWESFQIAEALRDVDWAYTVAFIPKSAISGAAIISLGCDEIVMGEQAQIGDVGVIFFDIQSAAYRYVDAKWLSTVVGAARTLAESKGHPPELAEAMIDKHAFLYRSKTVDIKLENANDRDTTPEFKLIRIAEDSTATAAEIAKRDGLDPNQWKFVPESGHERFLTINAESAQQLGLATGTANDRMVLGEQLDIKQNWYVQKFKTTDSVVYWLNTPVITGLLIIIGLVSLYLELSAPGIGAGGLIAGLCAVLFFWSRFMGGTSGWLEVILFLAGVTFILMEVFVIPGWGVSGFLGLALLLASVIMASQDFVVPHSDRQWTHLITTTLVVVCAGIIFVAAAAVISSRIGSIPGLSRLVLHPTEDTTTQDTANKDQDSTSAKKNPHATHPDVSIGDWGTAESMLRPAGRAKFAGKSFDVVSDGEFIEPGNQVRVVTIKGNRVVVVRVPDDERDRSTTA